MRTDAMSIGAVVIIRRGNVRSVHERDIVGRYARQASRVPVKRRSVIDHGAIGLSHSLAAGAGAQFEEIRSRCSNRARIEPCADNRRPNYQQEEMNFFFHYKGLIYFGHSFYL